MRLAAAPILALAFAVPALAFTPDRAAMMVDAVRANGCAMAGDEAQGALAPLGLDALEVHSFVDTLFGAGLVALSEDGNVLRLTEPLCAADPEAALAMIEGAFEAAEPQLTRWVPDFAPERGATLIGAVRDAGCSLSDAEAEDVLPPLGFSPVEARDIVTLLVETGQAQIDATGSAMMLDAALCAAEAEGDTEAVIAMIAAWHADNPEGDAPSVVVTP